MSNSMGLCVVRYHRVPFFKGYRFCKGTKKGNYLHESTLMSSLQSVIRVTIEFPLIFSETNLVEVPKMYEIRKICRPQKRHPTVSFHG